MITIRIKGNIVKITNIKRQTRSQHPYGPLTGDLRIICRILINNKKHESIYLIVKPLILSMNKILWEDDRQIKEVNLSLEYVNCEENQGAVLMVENR